MKKDETGGARENENFMHNFSRKTSREDTTWEI
jgi:hypothetical protein